MQRMQVEGGDVDRAAARLAVETVELVRASLADLWPAPVAPPAPPATVEKPAAPRAPWLALGVAVGQVRDFGDAPAFWVPQIVATYGNPARVGLRLSASGFGPGTGVTATAGSARLERAMVTLGVVHSFRSDRVLQPLIGIAGGAHYLSVHGIAVSSSLQAHDRGAVSALATVSAGVAVALGRRIAVVVEADLMVLSPTVAVRVYDAQVARIDRFSLFTHGGLLATF